MEIEERIQMMTQKAVAVSTVVSQITSFNEAIDYTVDLCRQKNMRTLAGPDLGQTIHDVLKDRCESARVTLLDSPLRDHASSIDMSLTMVEYGIADTGTIMLKSDSEEIRIATMLSQIHVAVLPVSMIKENTEEIEPELDAVLKSDAPSYTAFITGPSRTADIERVLAIGVHGPVALHLLLLKEN